MLALSSDYCHLCFRVLEGLTLRTYETASVHYMFKRNGSGMDRLALSRRTCHCLIEDLINEYKLLLCLLDRPPCLVVDDI